MSDSVSASPAASNDAAATIEDFFAPNGAHKVRQPELWLREHPEHVPDAGHVLDRLLFLIAEYPARIALCRERVANGKRGAKRDLLRAETELAAFRTLLQAAMAAQAIGNEGRIRRELWGIEWLYQSAASEGR